MLKPSAYFGSCADSCARVRPQAHTVNSAGRILAIAIIIFCSWKRAKLLAVARLVPFFLATRRPEVIVVFPPISERCLIF